MPRIQQLPPTLINQIAAGEVVERPASVLKELLENAVDAGARRIDVEVARGGSDLIRVVDNGCGIEPEDLPLAFASHATSKLRDVEDLFNIGTLGFRGEALASVGSIAQVTLQSRPADRPSGAAITCHGGQLSPVAPWNGSPGTRIEVKHLFYNTPARRKFLKGVGTEMGHVSEAFTRMALAQLGVHFTLTHNGKLLHEVPTSMGLPDRIGLFFGSELRNSLHMVETQEGYVALGGYVGDPSCDRGNSQTQYLFLNGRWVRDRGLFQAVQDAYRGLLMVNRYPVAFLFLEVPADQVDVNVHPTKAEVRFQNRDKLYQLVHQAVSDCLKKADLTARMQIKTRKEYQPASLDDLRSPTIGETGVSTRPAREEVRAAAAAKEASTPTRTLMAPREVPGAQQITTVSAERAAPPPPSVDLFGPAHGQKEGPAKMERVALATTGVKAMQVLDCYLVVEASPDEVLFIDQHALHERVLFEQLQERIHSGRLEKQRLLVPQTIDLSASQAALVLEQREALAELGLEVEPFGSGTLALNSYPALLGKHLPRAVLQAVVDYLLNKGRLPSREEMLNDLLSLMACHAAVRAGDRLPQELIAELLAQRQLAQDSHHCPHGRPTSLRFSRRDLERHFKRV